MAMQHLSTQQRKFMVLYRKAEKNIQEILSSLSIDAARLVRWMKNPYFREDIVRTNRAFRVIEAGDMHRLAIECFKSSKKHLKDKEHGPAFTLQLLKTIGGHLSGTSPRRNRSRRGNLIAAENMIHAAKLMKEMTAGAADKKAPRRHAKTQKTCDGTVASV